MSDVLSCDQVHPQQDIYHPDGHPVGRPANHLETTAEELLTVVQEMFPGQISQAIAELTIRKQAAEIARLNQLLNPAPAPMVSD